MGNSLSVVLDNYIGTAPIPCHLQLGKTTSIDLSRDLTSEKDDSGVVNETFKVLYKVDNKTCDICLVRHSNAEKVKFVISDIAYLCTYAKFDMVITETNYIRIGRFRWMTIDSKKSTKTNKSFDAWGGVVDTTVHLYGNGRRRGLLVKESKKNTREEETAVVTVAHYFVTSSGTSFDRSSGTDIGLSVVAKCGVSNGKFDITVEGPQQHPVINGGVKCFGSLTVKTVTVFLYQYLVPPPNLQEESPMVEGSRETVMVILLKTML